MAWVQGLLCRIGKSSHWLLLHGHGFLYGSFLHWDPPITSEDFSHTHLGTSPAILPCMLAILHSTTSTTNIPNHFGTYDFNLLMGVVCCCDQRSIWAQW